MEVYYNDYATFLKYYYNAPVYKIPINLADGNCPNRDDAFPPGAAPFAMLQAVVFNACRTICLLPTKSPKTRRFTKNASSVSNSL